MTFFNTSNLILAWINKARETGKDLGPSSFSTSFDAQFLETIQPDAGIFFLLSIVEWISEKNRTAASLRISDGANLMKTLQL